MKYVKCVVWDLDNTLWQGTLLEGDNVKLQPGMIEILQTLDSRGVLMSIASRNEIEHAMGVLKQLGIDHYFLYPQIGWQSKSASISLIQQKLNIGIDTILFIDDQGFERDEVQSIHESVEVLDAVNYTQLLSLPRLNPKIITEDSARRRLMYLEDQKRQQDEQASAGSKLEFLEQLQMEFTITKAKEVDLQRAEELTVRTNQLNSTGITYDYDQLRALLDSPNHQLWICELKDKYGSYGKIGLALVELSEEALNIRLLLMSCRIVSRGVGTVLLSFLMKQAKMIDKRLQADFVRTSTNRQMLLTYQLAGFTERERDNERITFVNDLTRIQDYPPYIQVITESIEFEEV